MKEKKTMKLSGLFARMAGGESDKRTLRLGGYSALLCFIALAIAVALVILVGTLPSSFLRRDLTSEALYSITDETKKLVSSLEEDVTITLWCEPGEEDAVISEMLNRYADLSSHITLQTKDPVTYPTFISEYTDESLDNNSLIVVSEKRSKVIPYTDIYVTDYDYSSYFTTGLTSSTTTYEGEGMLTQALDFVTSDVLPKIYCLEGHGETSLPTYFSEAIAGENMTVETLSLLSVNAIPTDCDCLILLAPTSDISEEEKEMILDYMSTGGNMILYTDYVTENMPNLAEIEAQYALSSVEGLVCEGNDEYHLRGYSYYLLPELGDDEIVEPLSEGGYYVLAPLAQGISVLSEYRSSLEVTPLLITSEDAYCKVGLSEGDSITKSAEDADGPFYIGVRVTETYNETVSNFIWYSSAAMLDESLDSYVSGGNLDLLLNTLESVCEKTESISIHGKSLDYTYLNLTAAQTSRLAVLFIGVIPAVILVGGVVVLLRRRKR